MKTLITAFVLWKFDAPVAFWVWFGLELLCRAWFFDLTKFDLTKGWK
jgi:hypothetical protein